MSSGREMMGKFSEYIFKGGSCITILNVLGLYLFTLVERA